MEDEAVDLLEGLKNVLARKADEVRKTITEDMHPNDEAFARIKIATFEEAAAIVGARIQ